MWLTRQKQPSLDFHWKRMERGCKVMVSESCRSGKQLDARGSWHITLNDSAGMLADGHGSPLQLLHGTITLNYNINVTVSHLHLLLSFLFPLFKNRYIELFMATCPFIYFVIEIWPKYFSIMWAYSAMSHHVCPSSSTKMEKWLMVCH